MTMTHQHGGDIYTYPGTMDFSSNCNPYGAPKGVKEALRASAEEICHYPDVECRALRAALEEAEGVERDWILCGNGAADLIFGLAFSRKPKKALLPAPTFAEYEQALRAAGCEIQYFYFREERGFLPGEDLIEQVTEAVDMMFFCNPNNPTGVFMERDFVRRLASRCKEKGVFLVLDECFTDFLDRPEEATMKPWLKEYPNLFLLKAFTKKYAMAGLRLGYGFCSDQKVLAAIKEVLQPWNVSVAAQKAGEAALKEKEYENTTLEKVRRERRRLTEEIKRLGVQIYGSQANYIFFKGPKGLQESCLKRGIYIRDCGNYRGLAPGYYRVAVRTREENKRLLEVLEKCLQEKKETFSIESGEQKKWQRQL